MKNLDSYYLSNINLFLAESQKTTTHQLRHTQTRSIKLLIKNTQFPKGNKPLQSTVSHTNHDLIQIPS